MAEQRYKAVQEVISSGKTVTHVAATWRVSRQTVHTWLARYEAGGLLAVRSIMFAPAVDSRNRKASTGD